MQQTASVADLFLDFTNSFSFNSGFHHSVKNFNFKDLSFFWRPCPLRTSTRFVVHKTPKLQSFQRKKLKRTTTQHASQNNYTACTPLRNSTRHFTANSNEQRRKLCSFLNVTSQW